jgi:hypothetical protein
MYACLRTSNSKQSSSVKSRLEIMEDDEKKNEESLRQEGDGRSFIPVHGQVGAIRSSDQTTHVRQGVRAKELHVPLHRR